MAVLTQKNGKTMLADEAYSALKKVVQVFLPAAGTLYFALASIWHLPSAEQVIGTIAAVTTFLGVSLHLSSAQYDSSGAGFDGTVHVTNTPEGSAVHLNVDPRDFVAKDAVTLKVISPPQTSDTSGTTRSVPLPPQPPPGS